MFPFTDLFIIQIIGLLRNRKFSGDCSFRIGILPTQFQFCEGLLVGACHGNLVNADALTKILWVCNGNIELTPKITTETGWNFSKFIDQLITESRLPMPESCSFMQSIALERSRINIQDESSFMTVGQTIYNNVRSGGSDISQAQSDLSSSEFWNGLFYLMGSGRIMGDYGKNLSVLLLKVQSDVIAHLQKVLGKRAADLYQERLSQEMDDRWPNLPKHKNYDRIYGAYDRVYGTAPYRTWAKLIGETTAKVASSALGHSCYKKALAALKPSEANLLQSLLN